MSNRKAKLAKIRSREIFGSRPGQGHKTEFVDRKKEVDRRACREWKGDE